MSPVPPNPDRGIDHHTDGDTVTRTGTETYYAQRAQEYDKVYAKPERQADLRHIEASLAPYFAERDVLEVATGTGYWTQFYADTAASVVATDLNDEVLDVAQKRRSWTNVDFVRANAFELDDIANGASFNGAFVGFFWSHLYLNQLPDFLEHLARQLSPGSAVMLLDNRYVEGSNHPITRTDDLGNTFQQRSLDNGTSWEVLKNFPTSAEITATLEAVLTNVSVTDYEYFWQATGEVP